MKKKSKPLISKKNLKKIGKFQQDVGEFQSDMSLMGSYIFFAFALLIGGGLIVAGIVAKGLEEGRWGFLGLGIFIIFIGIIGLIISIYTNRVVHKNKSVAQLYGTMGEINMVKGIFK